MILITKEEAIARWKSKKHVYLMYNDYESESLVTNLKMIEEHEDEYGYEYQEEAKE